MKTAKSQTRKPKFKIGDHVRVKGLPHYHGKIGFVKYDSANKMWAYKVHGQQGQYLTWNEGSLKKVASRGKQ